MGKLFFYSDQIIESSGNQRLDNILFAQSTNKIQIGYIPSTEDKNKEYFNIKVQYYRNYGVENIMFFDLYNDFDPQKIKELIKCDIIHLSAGNPIEFNNAIKNRNMAQVLSDYFKNGGTIVGVSGGAVQLGKSTKLFQLFSGIKSDKNSDTLQLVDFEFLPHYNRWNDDFKNKVIKYSQVTGTKVYAGNDGDGLIVDGDNISMIGDIEVIDGVK